MRTRLPVLLFLLLPAILICSGCEEVIDLKLDNADPVIVIEASLSDQNEVQTVRISTTTPFTEPAAFNPFTGASVKLSIPGGTELSFSETEPGVYRSRRFRGVPGNSYTLNISANGQVYSATSVMPQRVQLDSLTFKRLTFFGSTNTYPVANYQDPAAVQNQYRYILRVNNVIGEDAVNEDRFNNGNVVADVIFHELEDIRTNDRIELELQTIDRNVFKYYFALQQNRGETGPPVAPANPVSNFDNGALGVFNAHTSSKFAVVVR
ncbi:MAG TPA: DUF4249 domain-containing protein [Sphingobacteriaceae bacterium]